MEIRDIRKGKALGAGALRAIGHVDRQETVEVMGRPCRQCRGRRARGYLEKAAPVELVQAAEQRLALFQMPRLDAPDVGYFRRVVHDVLRITSGSPAGLPAGRPAPSPAARRAASRGAPARCRGTAGFWPQATAARGTPLRSV